MNNSLAKNLRGGGEGSSRQEPRLQRSSNHFSRGVCTRRRRSNAGLPDFQSPRLDSSSADDTYQFRQSNITNESEAAARREVVGTRKMGLTGVD